MALADDVAGWIQANAAPAGATVHAHRQPDDHGVADVLVVALERSRDSYLFGRGRGFGAGGESEIRIGLWWIVNRRRDAAQRTPERALDGLQPVYDVLLDVRRQTIGDALVRHVAAGLGPVLRATEAEDEIVAYARVDLHVQGSR
ncbi:MAG: hypothetical protein F4018_12915 [Acidobacteria bacterium]|nr:hypothetical protein [Acidobacteriota bacterium]MYK89153.1 hypothetical protein [Acidobacteriota bacterium]